MPIFRIFERGTVLGIGYLLGAFSTPERAGNMLPAARLCKRKTLVLSMRGGRPTF
jgi:hypothetical protein